VTQWYQARQLETTKRWHYTCSNTSGKSIYPVGACASNCAGHETAAEAVRHDAEGLAAGELREIDDEAEQRRCVICNEWTQHRVLLWGAPHFSPLPICQGHDPRPAIRADVFKHYNVEAT
jgi:hypothetical protein